MADSRGMDQVVKKKSKKSRSPKKATPVPIAAMRLQIESTIRTIPRGKVSTYGAIAATAGFPGNARFVARVLHRGFDLPWQRVLGSGGEIKLRGDAAIEQRLRLEAEGVRFRGRKVDMKHNGMKFVQRVADNSL